MAEKVYILSGARTPIASFRGSFKDTSSVELGKNALLAAIQRSGVNADSIEEVIGGSVYTANCGQNVTRQIALSSGLPNSVQAVTINKVCSSSMKALVMGCVSIRSGYRQTVAVVGTENMSQVPFYVTRGEIPYGGMQLIDGIPKDGLEDATYKQSMGQCAEKTVKDYGISREEQDRYAIASYKKAAAAWQNGAFSQEVIPVAVKVLRKPDVVIAQDEEFKKLVEDKVPTLRPVFLKEGGTITAANASSLNDGAAAAILVDERHVPQGYQPLAEIVDYAEAGVDPVDFTIAPLFAVKKLLSRNSLSPTDIHLWEVNEAFSVTVLAFMRDLGLDENRVNVKGGAVAMGHPLGMSGLRIVLSLAYSLQPGQLGIAAICNGGGEATCVLLRKI